MPAGQFSEKESSISFIRSSILSTGGFIGHTVASRYIRQAGFAG
jgi:hypothetical protein